MAVVNLTLARELVKNVQEDNMTSVFVCIFCLNKAGVTTKDTIFGCFDGEIEDYCVICPTEKKSTCIQRVVPPTKDTSHVGVCSNCHLNMKEWILRMTFIQA